MLSKQFQKELDRGMPDPVYYLWSEEACFLEDMLPGIVRAVIGSGPEDFNYDLFYPASGLQSIFDAASTLPFMAQRRLIVIKDFHQFPTSEVKSLSAYFDEPSESSCMVVLSQKAPKASLKFKWKVFSINIRDRDIPVWLKDMAARKGITLESEAVDYLIEFVGYEIGLLMMEVEKFALSGSSRITGKDVLSSTSMMRKFSSFDLIDTLIAGKKSRALRILKTMLSGNAFDAPVILGTLNWHFGQFYSLWLDKGKRPAKMRERTYRTLSRHLKGFDEDKFRYIFQSLHEADLGIKTSGRPELVLENLVIKLLQMGVWN